MKVKDALFALQQLNPEFDLLVQAPDGGEPYAVANIHIGKWVDDDGKREAVAVIGIIV